MEKVEKVMAAMWLAVGVCSLFTIFFGAWWHIFTASICFIMFFAATRKKDENTK